MMNQAAVRSIRAIQVEYIDQRPDCGAAWVSFGSFLDPPVHDDLVIQLSPHSRRGNEEL